MMTTKEQVEKDNELNLDAAAAEAIQEHLQELPAEPPAVNATFVEKVLQVRERVVEGLSGEAGPDGLLTKDAAEQAIDSAIGGVLGIVENGPYTLVGTFIEEDGDTPVDVDITEGLMREFYSKINS